MSTLFINQKLIKVFLVVALLVAVALELDINIAQSHNIYLNSYLKNNDFTVVQVASGDSVWSIASQFVGDKEDIRELIIAIRHINQLTASAAIYPGQALKIPVQVKPAQFVPGIVAKNK